MPNSSNGFPIGFICSVSMLRRLFQKIWSINFLFAGPILCFSFTFFSPFDCLQFCLYFFCGLSNSCQHSVNADVIANMKSKIIVPHWHFFADVIFSATSKVQNYQNKTGEKSLYPSKYVLTTYFTEF